MGHFVCYSNTNMAIFFLTIFQTFPNIFRRFPKILLKLSEGQTNVSEHFPNHEDFRRFPRKN